MKPWYQEEQDRVRKLRKATLGVQPQPMTPAPMPLVGKALVAFLMTERRTQGGAG